MSARDEALDLIEKILPPEHAKAYRRVFSKKLDAYAHELAEKIRTRGVLQWEGMNEGVRLLRKERAQCADLIDPESAP